MKTGRKRLAFWICMIAAQTGAFVIFKDLADISQWVVQSTREFTMTVWYHRYWISGISSVLLLAALILSATDRAVCRRGWVAALTVLFAANLYSGMVNPNWMFRPLQTDATFVSVDDAPAFMKRSLERARFGNDNYASVEDINVVVLETDNGAYAYSDYYLLQPHVAEGDTVNGTEVVMTYCGLTNLAIAYSPVIDGQPLDLSVMTQLKNNLVLKDANTGEPIQQLWGTMEGAPERGAMQEFATVRMPFGSFKSLYPDGRVFVNEIPNFSDNPVLAVWDRIVRDGMMLWGVGLQWVHPDKAAFPTIPSPDPRLAMKQLVHAINVNSDYVAYTKDFIIDQGGTLNVDIGGRAVVIDYNDTYDLVAAFFNDTNEPVVSIDPFGRTGDGRQLERVNTLKSDIFWFIFAEFYPQTDVNRA